MSSPILISPTRANSTKELVIHERLDAKKRNDLYGTKPINPFHDLRLRNNLSLIELALASNMDRKAISRLEEGMYANPLPSAVRYWVEVRSLISEGELWGMYEDYQLAQRARHPKFFGDSLVINTATAFHPFRQLRSNRPALHDSALVLPVGITDLCSALCLPLDTIQFWEKKWRNQQTVPKSVKVVLNQTGYTRIEIAEFENQYKVWRNEHKQVNMV